MSSTTTETTAEVLERMFKEHTGFCSTWGQNQKRCYESEPEATLEVDWANEGEEFDFGVEINLYHWLKDRLEYNPDLNERYREYCREEGLALDLQSAESFAEHVKGKGIHRYGDPLVIDSTNEDGNDLLSQAIRFVYWTDEEGDAYVLLQIRNSSYGNRGYCTPVAFDVDGADGTAIFNNKHASVSCAKCCRHWDTIDGVSWVSSEPGGRDLQEYVVTEEECKYADLDAIGQLLLPIDLPERPTPDIGLVWVDEDGKAHCPTCGGVLEAWFWPAG